MVRSRRSRWGFALLAAAVPVLCVAAVVGGLFAPRDRSFDVTLLAPTAYLSVALLALLAPLARAAATSCSPPSSSSPTRSPRARSLPRLPRPDAAEPGLDDAADRPARPDGVRQRAHPAMPLALLTCLAFIAFVTVAGQALAWLVIGVRQRPAGRRLTWAGRRSPRDGRRAGRAHAGTSPTCSTGHRRPRWSPVPSPVPGVLGRWSRDHRVLLVVAAVVLDRVGRRLCLGPAAARLGLVGPAPGRYAGDGRRQPARASVLADRPRQRLAVAGAAPRAARPRHPARAWSPRWPGWTGPLWSCCPAWSPPAPGCSSGSTRSASTARAPCGWRRCRCGHGTLFWSKSQVVAETCALAVVITVAAGVPPRRAGRPRPARRPRWRRCAVVVMLRVVATCMSSR